MLNNGFVFDPDAWVSFFLGAGWCARLNFSVVALGIWDNVKGERRVSRAPLNFCMVLFDTPGAGPGHAEGHDAQRTKLAFLIHLRRNKYYICGIMIVVLFLSALHQFRRIQLTKSSKQKLKPHHDVLDVVDI